MSAFSLYFQLGFQHISDLKGYDHILFIVAICAAYPIKQWRNLLVLITAFTLGHSFTLALSTLNYLLIPGEIIEFLIPVTIFVTAIHNVFRKSLKEEKKASWTAYGFAMFFGLIHGLGFSNYLKQLLGMENNILLPLFSFNIGLEIGQIAILAVFLLITFVIVHLLRFPHREWNLIVSGAAAGIALILISETKFW